MLRSRCRLVYFATTTKGGECAKRKLIKIAKQYEKATDTVF
jgi:hypothetical protein